MQRIKLFCIPPPVEQLSILARLAFMEYVIEYNMFLSVSAMELNLRFFNKLKTHLLFCIYKEMALN